MNVFTRIYCIIVMIFNITLMRPKFVYWIVVLFLSSFSLFAQEQETADDLSLDKGPISSQFDYVITKSSRYQDYKVVKEAWLHRLKAHVSDSLKNARNELAKTQRFLEGKNNQVDSLESQLQNTEEKLELAIKDKNTILLLGMPTDKNVYNSIVLFILAVLAVSLIVFVILYKRSNRITVLTRNDLEETKSEYDKYRKNAREKEERLVVKHHDEMMKLKRQQGGL
jgi:hypothetical protein